MSRPSLDQQQAELDTAEREHLEDVVAEMREREDLHGTTPLGRAVFGPLTVTDSRKWTPSRDSPQIAPICGVNRRTARCRFVGPIGRTKYGEFEGRESAELGAMDGSKSGFYFAPIRRNFGWALQDLNPRQLGPKPSTLSRLS